MPEVPIPMPDFRDLSLGNDWDLWENARSNPDSLSRLDWFAVRNAYLDYLGGFSEMSSEDGTSCTLADPKETANQPLCHAPNGLLLQLSCEGQSFGVTHPQASHRRAIDLRYGLYRRESRFQEAGKRLDLQQERFASAYDLHLLGQQSSIQVQQRMAVSLEIGISWAGQEFDSEASKPLLPEANESHLAFLTVDPQGNQLACVLGWELSGLAGLEVETILREEGLFQQFRGTVSPNQPLVLEQFVSIYHDLDMQRLARRPRYQGTLDPLIAAQQDISDTLDSGYLYARQVHEQQWDRSWEQIPTSPDRSLAAIQQRHQLFHDLLEESRQRFIQEDSLANFPFGRTGSEG